MLIIQNTESPLGGLLNNQNQKHKSDNCILAKSGHLLIANKYTLQFKSEKLLMILIKQQCASNAEFNLVDDIQL